MTWLGDVTTLYLDNHEYEVQGENEEEPPRQPLIIPQNITARRLDIVGCSVRPFLETLLATPVLQSQQLTALSISLKHQYLDILQSVINAVASSLAELALDTYGLSVDTISNAGEFHLPNCIISCPDRILQMARVAYSIWLPFVV